MMHSLRALLVGAILALSIGTAGAQSPAQKEMKLSIERQPIRDALNEWAKQTGYQLVSEIGSEHIAPKIAGRLTPQAALEQLIKGTTLRYEWLSERVVAIREKSSVTPAALQSDADQKRLTVPIARFSDETPREWHVAASTPGSASVGESNAAVRSARAGESKDDLEEVIVTGTHIRGIYSPAQTISIGRDEISKTGFTTVQELAESLPQNFSEISEDGRFAVEGGSTLAVRNSDRVSSVNLRGLGAQSTLTLVNGMRYASSVGGRIFDVSTIPLSMIERVDVVTGGHSAIYGSDAVAGVVNLVTRRDFQGLQSQISYGGADEGGERLHVSQLGGLVGDRGGFALGYEFSRDWVFDLADAKLLSTQPILSAGGLTETSLQAQPDVWRHSALFSGHYDITDTIELFGSVLYTSRRLDEQERKRNAGAASESVSNTKHPSDLSAATLGARIALPKDWKLTLETIYSETQTDTELSSRNVFAFGSSNTTFFQEDESSNSGVSAIADGELPQIGYLTPRIAIGVEVREEDYSLRQASNGIASPTRGDSRNVKSAFAEVVLPLAGNGSVRGMKRLDLSVAGRHDEYSDFGDTTNPQAAILWEPLDGLLLRAGYSEAFRAPALVELADLSTGLFFNAADPRSPTGRSGLIVLRGDNPDLGPETAETWNVGLELTPQSLPGTNFSVSYFNVEYTDRLEVPAISFADALVALTFEDRFAGLIQRQLSADALTETISRAFSTQGFFNLSGTAFGPCAVGARCNPTGAQLLAAFPTAVLFDNRTNNISTDRVSGIDLLLKSAVQSGLGEVTFGLNGTYVLEHERNITATSPAFSLVNQVGKPVDLRLRANVGWEKWPYGVFAYVNYVDGYVNPYSVPASEISSWTTIDLTFQLNYTEAAPSSMLSGVVATISVDNVLDKRPPRYANSLYGALYDTTNANPFGRYLSLRVQKKW